MAVPVVDARRRLVGLIKQVNNDQVAVEVVSSAGTAFLVPADEYRSLVETVYLLKCPENARRLGESLAEAVHRDAKRQGLIQ